MPTPNYGYEKRQKELAKKRKKEDKLRAKADRKVGGAEDGTEPQDSTEVSQAVQGHANPGTPQN